MKPAVKKPPLEKRRKPPEGSADAKFARDIPLPEVAPSERDAAVQTPRAAPSQQAEPSPGVASEVDPLARLREALAQEGSNLANHQGPTGYMGLVFMRLANAIAPEPAPAAPEAQPAPELQGMGQEPEPLFGQPQGQNNAPTETSE